MLALWIIMSAQESGRTNLVYSRIIYQLKEERILPKNHSSNHFTKKKKSSGINFLSRLVMGCICQDMLSWTAVSWKRNAICHFFFLSFLKNTACWKCHSVNTCCKLRWPSSEVQTLILASKTLSLCNSKEVCSFRYL